MYKYETIHRLEWCEEDDCIRVLDSNEQEVHVFWNDDLDNLLENPNFGPDAKVVACMLKEFDHWCGDVIKMTYSTYDRNLGLVLEIIKLRNPFLAAMSRIRQSKITDNLAISFKANSMEYCLPEFLDTTTDLIEEHSNKSVLISYLELATANHSTYSRLQIDFYIDELDSMENSLFPREEDEEDE